MSQIFSCKMSLFEGEGNPHHIYATATERCNLGSLTQQTLPCLSLHLQQYQVTLRKIPS